MPIVKKILQYSLITFAIQTGLLFNSAQGMNVKQVKDETKETKECSICFEQISDKDAKKTSCEHIFHQNCLDQWYVTSKHKNCPVCRKKLSAPSKLEQKRAQEQLKEQRARELEDASEARRLQEREYQLNIGTQQRVNAHLLSFFLSQVRRRLQEQELNLELRQRVRLLQQQVRNRDNPPISWFVPTFYIGLLLASIVIANVIGYLYNRRGVAHERS